jgi:hypothetical protein
MAPDPANFLISSLKKNQKEDYGSPPTFCISSHGSRSQKESGKKLYGSRSRQLCSSAPSKRIWPKIILLQIPPTFFMSSLKKNPAENYMAPDPANFLHQLPQKEFGGKLYGSRSRQLSHQLPQKESGGKLYGSRSRQLSASAPSKRIGRKNMASDPANFLHQLPQKESGRKLLHR